MPKTKDQAKKWLKAAGIRVIRTFAHTAIGTISSAVLLSEVDWKLVISSTVLACILSFLHSLAGLPEVDK